MSTEAMFIVLMSLQFIVLLMLCMNAYDSHKSLSYYRKAHERQIEDQIAMLDLMKEHREIMLQMTQEHIKSVEGKRRDFLNRN